MTGLLLVSLAIATCCCAGGYLIRLSNAAHPDPRHPTTIGKTRRRTDLATAIPASSFRDRKLTKSEKAAWATIEAHWNNDQTTI